MNELFLLLVLAIATVVCSPVKRYMTPGPSYDRTTPPSGWGGHGGSGSSCSRRAIRRELNHMDAQLGPMPIRDRLMETAIREFETRCKINLDELKREFGLHTGTAAPTPGYTTTGEIYTSHEDTPTPMDYGYDFGITGGTGGPSQPTVTGIIDDGPGFGTTDETGLPDASPVPWWEKNDHCSMDLYIQPRIDHIHATMWGGSDRDRELNYFIAERERECGIELQFLRDRYGLYLGSTPTYLVQ